MLTNVLYSRAGALQSGIEHSLRKDMERSASGVVLSLGLGSNGYHASSRELNEHTYLDKYTGSLYDFGAPQLSGWLTKRSKHWGDWRRRFVRIQGSVLFFAEVIPHTYATSTRPSLTRASGVPCDRASSPRLRHRMAWWTWPNAPIACDRWSTGTSTALNSPIR